MFKVQITIRGGDKSKAGGGTVFRVGELGQ